MYGCDLSRPDSSERLRAFVIEQRKTRDVRQGGMPPCFMCANDKHGCGNAAALHHVLRLFSRHLLSPRAQTARMQFDSITKGRTRKGFALSPIADTHVGVSLRRYRSDKGACSPCFSRDKSRLYIIVSPPWPQHCPRG